MNNNNNNNNNNNIFSFFIFNCLLSLPIDTFISFIYHYLDYNNLSEDDLNEALIRFADKHNVRDEFINTILNKTDKNK